VKHTKLLSLISVVILFGCNYPAKSTHSTKSKIDDKSNPPTKNNSAIIKLADSSKDKVAIQSLIRQMLKWDGGSIDLIPELSKDSICTGLDFDKLNYNLKKLKETEFFADEFINNYSHIIHTLDKKIKNKEFSKWNVYGELPPFNFDNDIDPWSSSQDAPYDNPNPADFVEVGIINLDNEKGELYWKWGRLAADADKSWKDFYYKFMVVRVSGKWKISWLQCFDYKESIKG
jgi:hypothetical protein